MALYTTDLQTLKYAVIKLMNNSGSSVLTTVHKLCE